jgi:hypothetical protein
MAVFQTLLSLTSHTRLRSYACQTAGTDILLQHVAHTGVSHHDRWHGGKVCLAESCEGLWQDLVVLLLPGALALSR